ncbi:MAG: YceI family protein [Acidimicrobiales bacterium]
MNVRSALRRPRTRLVAVPVVVVLALVSGPFVYINFIRDETPERLSLDGAATTTQADGATTTTATEPEPTPASVDGSWAVTDGSQAGYRVAEVRLGQDAEAVGRTSDVTGQLLITGATIDSATFEVDLTTVASDDNRRDNQFRTRIMDTATYPTATFELSGPIDLTSVPADLEEVTVTAVGELTLRGVNNEVTFDLTARRNGDTIAVNGTIPLTFADYEIPDASFGPATVGDVGEIELLLDFTPDAP